MPDDLIDRLWSQALREGVGVTGVGRRMAQLVAEECAKEVTARYDEHPDCISAAIRDKFCQPPV